MAVIALANIYDGLKSYTPGEVIEGLTEKEERRLIELRYAEPAPISAAAVKTTKKRT